MASKQKVIQMVGAIKTLYSYYAKDTDEAQLVQLWVGLLKDYADDEASYGLAEAMKVCKVPPTPADVIGHIEKRRDLLRDTDVEVWEKVRRGLTECYRLTAYFGVSEPVSEDKTVDMLAREKITTVWENLPFEAQRFIGSEREFIRKSKLDDKSLQIEEARFRKQFSDLRSQAKTAERAKITTPERRLIND